MISFSDPYRIVIVITICCSAFIQEVLPAETKLSEEKLREIAKLRAELGQAFDKHEEASVAAKGVVVQPTWLKSEKVATAKGSTKVTVTDAGLEEARRLREEIAKAVKDDVYAAGITTSDAKDMQRLEKSFGLKEHSKGVLQSMVGAEQASSGATNPNDREEDESVGAMDELDEATATAAAAGGGPNVVESSAAMEPADLDIRKLQRLEVAKRRTKEVLVLTAIEEDLDFNLGDDVVEWAHIRHDGREYFVGRRDHDLVIVEEEAAAGSLRYGKGAVLEVGHAIACLETYSHWDLGRQRQEGVLLVATDGDQVRFYRGLDLFWEWRTGRAVAGLTYFKVEAHEYLAVASTESSRSGLFALNIYEFELQAQEFWIVQRLQLRHPCTAVAVLDTGRDLVLAVAQNRTAAHIYMFNPRDQSATNGGDGHLRFQLRQQIESEGVASVAAFEMGGRNYLAVGGAQSQILLYQQGEFVPRTVFGDNFGLVELFLPVPVHTYRDDLLLLVQHRVDFGTHALNVLETLVWNGESFETSIPVPCHLGPHTVYGASCLLDPQRDEGLRGATLLRRGDEIALIVPRRDAESGLFRLHTELLARNSELLDLQEIFAFLQDWVREQDDLVAQAQAFIGSHDPESPQATESAPPDLSELEELRTPELEFFGDVGEIHVNDHRWSEQDAAVDLDVLMKSIEDLGRQLMGPGGRHRREVQDVAMDQSEINKDPSELTRDHSELTLDTLELDSLEVDDLLLELLNGDRFFVHDGALDFAGVLNLASLEVLQEAPSPDEVLEVDGNLEFEEINGVSWQELRQGLVFRNNHMRLDELEVEGEVVVEDRLWTNHLNSMAFPEDFLWSSGPTTSVVRAEKSFLGTLASDAVDTGGPINGVNPFDAITLAEPQRWTGSTTFARLEVSERLELLGSAQGRGLEEFESNPTLLESRNLEAACSFAHLEVNGPILVRGDYENRKLHELLEDIVQRPVDVDKDEILVSARKNFSALHLPVDLRVGSGRVNRIAVGDFVPAHTAQTLDVAALPAYVYFRNLTLGGAFDGVNVSELMERSIRIDADAPQTEVALDSTQLNFAQGIAAERLEVERTLNGVDIASGFQTLLEDLKVHELHVDELRARVGDVATDIRGEGTLNGLKLKEFLGQRTWSEPAPNSGNIFLDELSLQSLDEGGLQTDSIHGIDADFLLGFLERIDDIPEMILDGKIQVDHVLVNGDVQVNQLNGHHFDEDVQLTAIWLDRPNFLSTRLRFEEPLLLRGAAFCEGALNQWPSLPDQLDDMAFRTTTTNETSSAAPLRILAPKSFAKDVAVGGDARVAAFNGLAFEHIATVGRTTTFAGSLRVHGDVEVGALETRGSLNDYPLTSLDRHLRFDPHLEAFVLRGEVPLPSGMQLEDLTVTRNLNEFANLDEFFAQLVFRHELCLLRGRATFTGRVSIEGGAYVRSLNGRNLLALMENVVFVREPQPVVIKAPIVFADTVRVRDVSVREAMTSSNLNGCSLEKWLEDTLRVDRNERVQGSLRFADGALDGNAFFAGSLNDVDLSRVITLHTPQNLSDVHLVLSELHLDGAMTSAGPVNGVDDLMAEYRNTLLTHGDQHVTNALTLPSSHVLGSLETRAPVNLGQGSPHTKDLRQVATLHNPNQDLEFRSPLFLQDLSVRHLLTRDLVSGVHLDAWMKGSLWTRGRGQQWIAGNWSVRQLEVRDGQRRVRQGGEGDDDPAKGESSMDDKTKDEITMNESSMDEASKDEPTNDQPTKDEPMKDETTKDLHPPRDQKAFHDLCQRVASRLRKREQRISFIKYLEEVLEMELRIDVENQETKPEKNHETKHPDPKLDPNSDPIRHVVPLAFNGTTAFLLLNTGCHSHLYRWNSSSGRFSSFSSFESGPIDQVVLLPTDEGEPGTLKFATKAETTDDFKCSIEGGLRSWAVDSTEGSESNPVVVVSQELLLPQPKDEDERSKRTPEPRSYRYRLPFFTPLASPTRSVSESVLKPKEATESTTPTTTPTERKLGFDDFKQLVERILEDLVYRLHLEVNVTQLSIPESDLYDEHLVQDFIAIMEELQRQELFPPSTFDDVSLETLQVPSNPAQVLAARTVQIVWPVIVEIEEVHGYLRDNETHSHPVCSCITASLGATIRDVLLLANRPKENSKDDDGNSKDDHKTSKDDVDDSMTVLMQVIERIRLFQRNLQELVRQLKAEIKEELPRDQGEETRDQMKSRNQEETMNQEESRDSDEAKDQKELSMNQEKLPIDQEKLPIDQKKLPKDQEKLLPDHNHEDPLLASPTQPQSNISPSLTTPPQHLLRGEQITLEVGPAHEPRPLTAFASPPLAHLVTDGGHDSVRLFLDPRDKSSLFQTIAAHRPRSLTALRLRDETLLAFGEDDGATLRVLVYRGVQGFVDLVRVPMAKGEEIRNLVTLSLAASGRERERRHFVVANVGRRVRFFEVQMAGDQSELPQVDCN